MVTGTPWMRIGTRGSPLALAQAHQARDRLAAAHGIAPEDMEIVVIKTTGDAIQDRALATAGGKGLFTRELDIALAERAIDIAVHSAKDMPTFLPPELVIAGYLPREDVRDVLIARGNATLAELGPGVLIGSASLRRQAMMRRLRPDVRVDLLRGNVQRRLDSVRKGDFDATMLAIAGLKRLGMPHIASEIFSTDQFLPAVGQGAISITARSADAAVLARLAPVLDAPTGIAVSAERAFLAVLDGSCRTPIAGHATVSDGRLAFRGQLLRVDGSEDWRSEGAGLVADAEAIGRQAGRDILALAPADVLAY